MLSGPYGGGMIGTYALEQEGHWFDPRECDC